MLGGAISLKATAIGLAAALALGGAGGALVQGWRLGARLAVADAALSKERSDRAETAQRASALALHNYTSMEATKNEAIKSAEARVSALQADFAGLAADRERMRESLAGVPARIATASRAAVDQYAAAATVVFEQCTARYSELAGKADGHANDVQLMQDAWPKASAPAAGGLGG